MKRFTLFFALLGWLTNSPAQTTVPVVRTADLSALLNGVHPAVDVVMRPEFNPPSPSVHADRVTWQGDEGKEMARIAALAPIDLKTEIGSDLYTVLYAICEKAPLKNFYIMQDDPVMSKPVTYSGIQRPWDLLQLFAKLYNLEVVFRNGVWQIYALDTNELVAKTYVLKNNTLERFRSSGTTGGNQGGNADNTANRSGNTGGNNGGGNSGGGSSVGGAGLSIDRTSLSVFQVDSKAIISEVEHFLGMPSELHAVIADRNGAVGMPGPRRGGAEKGDATVPGAARKGMVSFTSDTNSLYVVASRAQHEMIAAWLADLDQPIKQIYIETKFLLTGVNPKSERGFLSPLLADGGVGVSMSGLTNENVDPARFSTWKFPKAILSADTMNARLAILNQDSNTSTVQYPQQTTLSGREVVLSSVRQIPIVSMSTQNVVDTTSQVNNQIQFVNVGTTISILPKVLDEVNVLLNLSITVSSVVDTVVIGGNPYPVVTDQTYTNQVIVQSGYSLALGGLEQTLQQENIRKVPLLGDIPWFGFAFKDHQKQFSRSVLTMVVTPTVMPNYTGGNTSGSAQHTLPARGTPPRIVFESKPGATVEDVVLSLRGFSRDYEELAMIVKEGRGDRTKRGRCQLLINELELMANVLVRERAAGLAAPSAEAEIKEYRARLQRLLREIPDTAPLSSL